MSKRLAAEDKKGLFVRFRTTNAEREQLKNLAKKENLSLTSYIRFVVQKYELEKIKRLA